MARRTPSPSRRNDEGAATPLHPLSAQERRAHAALLSRPDGLSSLDLVDVLWPDPDRRPLNARTAASDAARRLGRKLEANGEGVRVRFSTRAGPTPSIITLEETE